MKNQWLQSGYFAASVLWMAVIYYFSDQPDLASGFSFWWDMVLRKSAHIAIYFVLTYLWYRFWREYGMKKTSALAGAASIALVYAGFDEWHQQFVAGRSGSVLDVAIDTVGIAAAVLSINFYKKI